MYFSYNNLVGIGVRRDTPRIESTDIDPNIYRQLILGRNTNLI